MDSKQEVSEVKTDVHLLLDCLKCQVDNPQAVKQAYKTLAAIFTNFPGNEVKDYFRSLGGLEFIVSSNKTVTNVEVLEAAFCCLGCAVENNVYSQKELSTASQFMAIHKILSDDKSTPRLKHAASYLLLTLVSNNSLGQSLAKKSLCLADLLGLLRTTLPSTGSKDCWFEDAGTTGLEAWSCVATALSMCVNNPQNEENQRVCGFVLPFVFSVLQQFEEEKVIKPMLSFIRFTVANNESNQTQVKRCGGLSVLSDKLKKFRNGCENSLPIAVISTLDACIADHAENGEEIGNLETVKLIMKFLNDENFTQEEKLQIIVTLVHAVEMSDKNKEHILEESGMYGLMKSLNGIESGDDELFKAIKYLLQLCSKQDGQEDCKNESAEMLDILKKTEALHRNSGMLLLHKINELSERLETFEQDSSRTYQQLVSPAFNTTDCHNMLPTSPAPEQSDCHIIEPKHMEVTLTPLHSKLDFNREFSSQMLPNNMTTDFLPHRASTPVVKYNHTDQGNDRLLHEHLSKNHLMAMTPSKFTDQRKNDLLHRHLPQNLPIAMTPSKMRNLPEHNSNQFCGRLPSSNTCMQSDFCHSHENINYNEGIHNVYTPRKSDGVCYEKHDKYGLGDINRNLNPATDENANIKTAYNNYVELSKLIPSVITDMQPHEYYYYLTSPKNLDESRSQQEAGVFEKRQLNTLYGNKMLSNKNLDMNYVNEKGDNSLTDLQHATKNLTEVFDYGHKSRVVSNFTCDKQVSDSLPDSIQGLEDIEKFKDPRYVAEPLPTQKYPTKGESIREVSRHEVNYKHFPKINSELDQNNNANSEYRSVAEGKEIDIEGHSDHANDQDDKENEAIFITGIQSNSKPAKKTKKYEIRIVESKEEDDNLSCKEPLVECNKNHNASGSVMTKKTPVFDIGEKLMKSSNHKSDIPVVVMASNCNESSHKMPLCKNQIKTNGQTSEFSDGKNLEKVSQSDEKKKDSDFEFVKPVGRPLRRKTRSSVRRTQPFWKQGSTSDTDTDYSSSCDEGSVFDKELVNKAQTMNNQQRNLNIHPISSLSTGNITGKSNFHQMLIEKSKFDVESNASSICSSPGSVYTSCSSLDSSYDLPQKNNKCPGCTGTISDINSRTLNINLETSPFTCSHHRAIREHERMFIKKLPTTAKVKKIKRLSTYQARNEDRGLSVYEISSDSENELSPLEPNNNKQLMTLHKKDLPTSRRRERVPFSQQETHNLMLGVDKFGRSWSLILQNFKFHESRTAVDLKDKQRGIQKRFNKTNFKQKQRGKPFSMCEDRRLLRGVKIHGYNWKQILKSLTFGKDRSSEDLRNRWRTLHKRQLKHID